MCANTAYKSEALQTSSSNNNDCDLPELHHDVVAVFSDLTKKILYPIWDLRDRMERSPIIKVLSKSSQPAHLVAMLAVVFVWFLLTSNKKVGSTESPLWTLVYLGSFSAHFGAQLWMTFVSGLVLFFTLPRHTFGSIQRVLFPKYFLINAVLSFITLTAFVTSNNNNLLQTDIVIQTWGLIICFLTEMTIRLYMTTPLLHLQTIKTEIESEAGVGTEIGTFEPKELLKSARYVTLHNQFRKMHMKIAMGNILSISLSVLHLVYLSQKLAAIL